MIVVRGVLQAKYGKSGDLLQLLKQGQTMWPSERHTRIMTDLSGPFFTVVSEAEYESLDAWQAEAEEIFADGRFASWFERMTALVEGGSREFYTLVE